jgi:hypothetical protein
MNRLCSRTRDVAAAALRDASADRLNLWSTTKAFAPKGGGGTWPAPMPDDFAPAEAHAGGAFTA